MLKIASWLAGNVTKGNGRITMKKWVYHDATMVSILLVRLFGEDHAFKHGSTWGIYAFSAVGLHYGKGNPAQATL